MSRFNRTLDMQIPTWQASNEKPRPNSAYCQTPLGRLRIDATAQGVTAVTLLEPGADMLQLDATATNTATERDITAKPLHQLTMAQYRVLTQQHNTTAATVCQHPDVAIKATGLPAWQLLSLQADSPAIQTVLQQAASQLGEYFAGSRQTFSVPLAPAGTAFQQQVWQYLQQIPYGETRSYGAQATALGKPSAMRAVGAANGRNPIAIIVPCHWVVAANGKLTGYAGGIAHKVWLLRHEADR